MNKSPIHSSLNTINFNEDWSSHPTIEWLTSNKKVIIWGFIALLACLILTYRLIAVRTLNAENDFFQAQTAFTQFQNVKSDSSADNHLKDLQSILKRHPELQARYDGAIAQTLLILGNPKEAQPFTEAIFKRTQPDQLQFYQDYSAGTFLISEKQYSKALQQTQQLQATLDQAHEQAPSILYVFNLIRLAMLYQQNGQAQQELQTWEQLQNQPQHLSAVLAANQALKIGQASLNQYIEERKKALTP